MGEHLGDDDSMFLELRGAPELVEQFLSGLGHQVRARRRIPGAEYVVQVAAPAGCVAGLLEEPFLSQLGWEQDGDPDRVIELFEFPFRPQPTEMADDGRWRTDAGAVVRTGLERAGFVVHAVAPTDQMPIDSVVPSPAGVAVGMVAFSTRVPTLDGVAVIRVDAVGVIHLEPRLESWHGPWPLISDD